MCIGAERAPCQKEKFFILWSSCFMWDWRLHTLSLQIKQFIGEKISMEINYLTYKISLYILLLFWNAFHCIELFKSWPNLIRDNWKVQINSKRLLNCLHLNTSPNILRISLLFKYKISSVERRLMCAWFFSDYWAIKKSMRGR